VPRALIVSIALLGACAEARERDQPGAPAPHEPAPPRRADPGDITLDGLRAAIEEVRRDPVLVSAWVVGERRWSRLVVGTFQRHWHTYRAAFDAAAPALRANLAAWRGGEIRWLYADTPEATPAQVRTRWMVPPGTRTAIAEGLPVVFVDAGTGWDVLVPLDADVVDTVDRAQPRCAGAALDVATKRCAEWAFAITDAALRGDTGAIRRGCAQATMLGCGAHPAEALP